MLRRLFGRGRAPAAPAPPPAPRPRWAAPAAPDEDCFALHLHGVEPSQALPLLSAHYLRHGEAGAPAMLLYPSGEWLSACFPRAIVRGVGFNRSASQLSRELGCWLVGYRLFAGEGGDAHLFHAGAHVEQWAFSSEGVELEPDSPAPFAPLANLSALLPRPPTQHPLDFHHALLDGLQIRPRLPWEAALARHQAGALPAATLVALPASGGAA